jgi:hypothetical protein
MHALNAPWERDGRVLNGLHALNALWERDGRECSACSVGEGRTSSPSGSFRGSPRPCPPSGQTHHPYIKNISVSCFGFEAVEGFVDLGGLQGLVGLP